MAKTLEIRINKQIRNVSDVRLVGDNIENDIYSFDEALELSNKLGLDLIEINPKATPPICKIMDFKKYQYEQKRKEKEQIKKQKKNNLELKEVRFTPNTDGHDYEFKLKNIQEFLQKGHTVKVGIFFKGREKLTPSRGIDILKKVILDCADIALSDTDKPILNGSRMSINLKPKK